MITEKIITTIPLSSITMSCEVDQLFTALSLLQGEMESVKKANHGHRHRYADINTVLDTILPLLSKHGLAVMQDPHTDDQGNQRLMTMICHKSGQWKSSSAKIIHDATDIQSLGAGITYQRRYALVSVLGIEQEDDDGNYSKQKKEVMRNNNDFARPIAKKDYTATGNLIKPEQVKHLKEQIALKDNKFNEIAKAIVQAVNTPNLSNLTEKQYHWILQRYLK